MQFAAIVLMQLTFNVKQDLDVPLDSEHTSRLTKLVALALFFFFFSI